MTNTDLWDRLGKTDPKHTKTFKRAGGFSGTAIKPMWSYRRMTEEFGPCGTGWGVCEPKFDVVTAGDEVLVYCTVSVWYETPNKTAVGVGGDKVMAKMSSGIRTDDEAFKKAYTDAVTNALKMIGVGADVHMGMFDDSKYVNTMAKEFSQEPPEKSSAQLKREDEWPKVTEEVAKDMLDVQTFGHFEKVKEHWRAEAKKRGWNKAFMFQLKDLFDGYEEELTKRIAAENDAVAGIEETFPGSRVVNETLHPMMAGE